MEIHIQVVLMEAHCLMVELVLAGLQAVALALMVTALYVMQVLLLFLL